MKFLRKTIKNNINENMQLNESTPKIGYQHILDVEHMNLTNWLRKYGFEIELITEYDFKGSNVVGMFLNSEQTDAHVFPIAINIPAILETARELSYDEYSFNNEIAYGFRGTLWHEAGHGIFEYLDSIYDLDDLNEEDVVEEFAEYQEDSELFDILTQYIKEYAEEDE